MPKPPKSKPAKKPPATAAPAKRIKTRPAGTKPVLVNVPKATLDALDDVITKLRTDPIHRDMTRTSLILVGIDLAVAKYGAGDR